MENRFGQMENRFGQMENRSGQIGNRSGPDTIINKGEGNLQMGNQNNKPVFISGLNKQQSKYSK